MRRICNKCKTIIESDFVSSCTCGGTYLDEAEYVNDVVNNSCPNEYVLAEIRKDEIDTI